MFDVFACHFCSSVLLLLLLLLLLFVVVVCGCCLMLLLVVVLENVVAVAGLKFKTRILKHETGCSCWKHNKSFGAGAAAWSKAFLRNA